MAPRKQFVTDSDDRQWLEVTPRAAAAGGLVVVALVAAMLLLQPGDRAAVHGAPTAPAQVQTSSLPALSIAPLGTEAGGDRGIQAGSDRGSEPGSDRREASSEAANETQAADIPPSF